MRVERFLRYSLTVVLAWLLVACGGGGGGGGSGGGPSSQPPAPQVTYASPPAYVQGQRSRRWRPPSPGPPPRSARPRRYRPD